MATSNKDRNLNQIPPSQNIKNMFFLSFVLFHLTSVSDHSLVVKMDVLHLSSISWER